MKEQTKETGYKRVDLWLDEIKKRMSVHRLVAFTFIPNPMNLPEIDHINNNRDDNRVENLRWISRVENINRRDCILNSKSYYPSRDGWQVAYPINGKSHTKRFINNDEDGAKFYVSLLKVLYPRQIPE